MTEKKYYQFIKKGIIHRDDFYLFDSLVKTPCCKVNVELRNHITDEVSYVEYDYFCPKCKKIIGHWAYGHITEIKLKENLFKRLLKRLFKKKDKSFLPF